MFNHQIYAVDWNKISSKSTLALQCSGRLSTCVGAGADDAAPGLSRNSRCGWNTDSAHLLIRLARTGLIDPTSDIIMVVCRDLADDRGGLNFRKKCKGKKRPIEDRMGRSQVECLDIWAFLGWSSLQWGKTIHRGYKQMNISQVTCDNIMCIIVKKCISVGSRYVLCLIIPWYLVDIIKYISWDVLYLSI